MADMTDPTSDDELADTKVDADVVERDAFGALLNHGGYVDVLVLSRTSARDVLTPDRLQIIDHLSEQDEPAIIDVLTQELGRDDDALRTDLQRLAELNVLTYDRSFDTPRPVLTHAHVVIEPIH